MSMDWHAFARSLNIDTRPILNGARMNVSSMPTFSTVNPFSQESVATYPVCDAAMVVSAVGCARSAFESGAWAHASLADRGSVFTKWADKIEGAAQTLALMDSLEMGMPITQALDDVTYSADYVREVAQLALGLAAPAGLTAPGSLSFNRNEPRGVVSAITPWNFPVNQVLVRLAPALIMGNSVVLKPSEIACASALLLVDLLLEAGLPSGVVTVLTGPGEPTGVALAKHKDIDFICFTGSTNTGARIQALAASTGLPKPMAMELGGKSPQIVCASYEDVNGVAETIAQGAFRNSGQVCSAGTLLIAHKSHAHALKEAIAQAMQVFVLGDPLLETTTLGPIATQAHAAAVKDKLNSATSVIARGPIPKSDAFITPHLIEVSDPQDVFASEELFAPVLTMLTYETQQEALSIASSSGFGLVATVWTQELAEGQMFAESLKAGSITINAGGGAGGFAPALGLEPYGRSGFGIDYGLAGLAQHMRTKLVTFRS